MNTLNGYSKNTLTDRYMLTASGGHRKISDSEFIVGTQTAVTGSWTGVTTDTELYDGKLITYWLPFAGSGTATLTLTFPNKTKSNAVPCYYGGTSRLTTYYGAGNSIRLTYRKNVTIGSTTIAEGWWADANYDVNVYTSAFCNTDSATAAKVASCHSYKANKSYVHLTLVYANTSQSALTLNINNLGAKPIYINGLASGSSNYNIPAGTYLVYCDEVNYYLRTDGYIPTLPLGYTLCKYTIDASSLNENTYYPVIFDLASIVGCNVRIECVVALNSDTQPSWATHTDGFSVRKVWESNGSGWGTCNAERRILVSSHNWCSEDPVRGIGLLVYSSKEYVFVRGGGKYFFYTSHNIIPQLKTETYTASDLSVSPTTIVPDLIKVTLGYIGTTAVQPSSAAQDLTGIKNLIPFTTKSYNLGTENLRWSNIYANNLLNIENTSGNVDLGMSIKGSQRSVKFIIGSDNYNRGIFDVTTNKWLFHADENDNCNILNTLITLHVRPNSNSTYNLGTSSIRWNNVYGVVGNFSTGVTAPYFGHAWESMFVPGLWNRLCYVGRCDENHVGASFIINLLEHRTSCVYNMTYLVNTHYDNRGHVTMLNGSTFNHSGYIKTRVIVDLAGNCYFEFKDEGPLKSTNASNYKVRCRLLPIACGSISTYTTALNGEGGLSGYVSSSEHVKSGVGLPELAYYWKNSIDTSGQLYQNQSVTISQSELVNGPKVFFSKLLTVPSKCSYTINLDPGHQFALLWANPGNLVLTTSGTVITIKPIYEFVVDGVVVKTTSGNCYLGFNGFNYTGRNDTGSDKTVTVAVRLKLILTSGTVTSTSVVKIYGSQAEYIKLSGSPMSLTTESKKVDGSFYNNTCSIRFNYTLKRDGGVMSTCDSSLYPNGYLHANEASNSLTYVNPDIIFLARGQTCLQLLNGKILVSNDYGSNWRNIFDLFNTV